MDITQELLFQAKQNQFWEIILLTIKLTIKSE